MFNNFLKSLSILKKFLFINLIIFIIIGSLTVLYLQTVKAKFNFKKDRKSYSGYQ
jgi:two-component system sensor histidine kinase ChvG